MRKVIAVGAVLVAALVLAGCSGTDASVSASDGMVAGETVVDGTAVDGGAPEAAVGAPAPGNGTSVTSGPAAAPADRQIVRTGTVSMRVEDVTAGAASVHALVKKRNGLISSEDAQSTGDSSYATITAQIPAAELDAFVADISALGTVDTVSIAAQDVTSQVVDLDARISALKTSITRLTQLLAQASRVEDLLAIETQLSQRQSDLDALTAQRTYLGEQVALSTITVSLTPLTEVTEIDAPGFLSGLTSGWSAFVSLIMIGVTAVGFLLPFALVLAVIAIPVTLILVRQARRRRRA